jgi:hypothetical protein
MVTNGIMAGDEFDACRESLERHLADPDTVVMWAYFQAWGTRP